DKAATETWTDRRGYYFCQTVAVLPGQQGKGIGKMLLKAVMDRADQEGFHCYLESTRYTPNVEIYKKHGFKVIKEITCKDASDACTVSLTGSCPWGSIEANLVLIDLVYGSRPSGPKVRVCR
ncbi:hypothetical protein KEM55_000288, partial [Ascosphaera atra]